MDWGLVVKTGVESGAVVEGFDVMEDGATALRLGWRSGGGKPVRI